MRTFLCIGDPVIPSSFPVELVELATEKGANKDALLRVSGLSGAPFGNPDYATSYRELGGLVRAVTRTLGDDGLGLEFGQRLVMGCWGVLGLATMSATTVGDALSLLVKYGQLVAPHSGFSQTLDGDGLHFVIEQHVRLGDVHSFASEAIAVSILSHLRAIAEAPIVPIEVRFDYPAPAHAARYGEVFGCPVVFDAKRVEIVLGAADRAVPLRYANASSAALSESQCVAAVGAMRARRSVVAEVRRLLRECDPSFPGIRAAARMLQSSERSLRRALSESGTSYQALIDEMRHEVAMRYLSSTGVPVEDIARLAGFSDGRSFRRAFKRWTGRTPGAVRRALVAQGAATVAAAPSQPVPRPAVPQASTPVLSRPVPSPAVSSIVGLGAHG